MTEAVPLQAPPAARRSAGLDALRGFAILTMVLSGVVPRAILPAWMYHCQVPPPLHKFDPGVPGITWVDLVFPFFLFSLGAAIPFALNRRMEKGMPVWQAVLTAVKRGLLLLFFAVYQQHMMPHSIAPNPDTRAWLLGLLGFALLFPMMMRLPDSWPAPRHWAVRAVGWGGGVALLVYLGLPDARAYLAANPFSVWGVVNAYTSKNNVILALLASAALFGTLAWIFTRGNLLMRLGLMGILLALRMSNSAPGWIQWIGGITGIPHLWGLGYLQYLHIVIPGTIAGDLLLAWMRAPVETEGAPGGWPAARFGWIAALMAAFVVVNLAGLQARWIPATVAANAALFLAGWKLLKNPADSTERLLASLYRWGMYWLALGLFFEPYESGIKKDPATMSYFFVTTGLALFVLIAFTVLIDVRRWSLGTRLLVDNGQNPMIAYVGIENLILPVFALTGFSTLLNRYTAGPWLGAWEPWVGTLRGVLLTLLLAVIVSVFTRRRVFWRT